MVPPKVKFSFYNYEHTSPQIFYLVTPINDPKITDGYILYRSQHPRPTQVKNGRSEDGPECC
uniref:Uncharacterized protein n=1 Tax=Rhizophora mucronata TaxID=61149 RepID=A0A2P2PM73_RHIMU